MGICCNIANSTLTDANEQRDCRIDADFALSLIQTARTLYARERCAVELEQVVYALATTTIDLCVSVSSLGRAPKASKDCPQSLRRIKFYDAAHDQDRAFLANHFGLPALTIAQLYRCRWQV